MGCWSDAQIILFHIPLRPTIRRDAIIIPMWRPAGFGPGLASRNPARAAREFRSVWGTGRGGRPALPLPLVPVPVPPPAGASAWADTRGGLWLCSDLGWLRGGSGAE